VGQALGSCRDIYGGSPDRDHREHDTSAGGSMDELAARRGNAHVAQVRPGSTRPGWTWLCLTCGAGALNEADTSASARQAAIDHSTDVTLLR
jgi:hypothetical protein